MLPHRRSILPAARCALGAALLVSVAACARDGRETVEVDSSGRRSAQEVSARPVDPIADSAAKLDSLFQRERAALNAEAQRLATLDRFSREYAEAFDAHRRRLLEAERLRAERDRLRRRAASGATPGR